MVGFFVFLCTLLVLAIVAIAIWLWLFVDIFEQVAALIRVKAEEQVAVWRIESISRISKMEQQRLRDERRS
jgi:hypothetical protein